MLDSTQDGNGHGKEDNEEGAKAENEEVEDGVDKSLLLNWHQLEMKECESPINVPHVFDMPRVPHSKMQVY